jgi:hypothetical protein
VGVPPPLVLSVAATAQLVTAEPVQAEPVRAEPAAEPAARSRRGSTWSTAMVRALKKAVRQHGRDWVAVSLVCRQQVE